MNLDIEIARPGRIPIAGAAGDGKIILSRELLPTQLCNTIYAGVIGHGGAVIFVEGEVSAGTGIEVELNLRRHSGVAHVLHHWAEWQNRALSDIDRNVFQWCGGSDGFTTGVDLLGVQVNPVCACWKVNTSRDRSFGRDGRDQQPRTQHELLILNI